MTAMEEVEERFRIRRERMAKVKADAEPFRIEAEKAKAEYESLKGTPCEGLAMVFWHQKEDAYWDAMRPYYDIQAGAV